jgi:hypothetical protein
MMARTLVGLTTLFLGPWVVLLAYAHVVRPIWRESWLAYAFLAAGFCVGLSGLLILKRRFEEWTFEWKLAAILAYSVALTISMPFIGLFAACTTGDCL